LFGDSRVGVRRAVVVPVMVRLGDGKVESELEARESFPLL